MTALAKLKDVTDNRTRKRLGVLNDNETRRERLWKECVSAAKLLVKQQDEMRFKIVDLANKCCIVHHGGRSTYERYTVIRFAKEVGITYKTLTEWMRVKRNIYDNLEEGQRGTFTLSTMRFLDHELRGRAGEKNFPSLVQAAYKKMEKEDPCTIKMKKYIKHLKSIHFNVSHQMMIKNCDEQVLVEIMHLCRQIASSLSYIDKKTSRS